MTKTLDSLTIELSPNEMALACSVVNNCGGDDGRPFADATSMPHFSAVYFCACAGVAFPELNADGQTLLASICKRIRDVI